MSTNETKKIKYQGFLTSKTGYIDSYTSRGLFNTSSSALIILDNGERITVNSADKNLEYLTDDQYNKIKQECKQRSKQEILDRSKGYITSLQIFNIQAAVSFFIVVLTFMTFRIGNFAEGIMQFSIFATVVGATFALLNEDKIRRSIKASKVRVFDFFIFPIIMILAPAISFLILL